MASQLKAPSDAACGFEHVVEGIFRGQGFVLCMQITFGIATEAFLEEREACPRVGRPVLGGDAPEIVECAAAFFRFLNDAPLQQVRRVDVIELLYRTAMVVKSLSIVE